jgi:hypothetical protein
MDKMGHFPYPDDMRTLFVVFAFALIGAAPASAKVSSHLAKKCEQMAVQAHPADLPDKPSATDLRRSYYRLCIHRHGIMDPERHQ